MSKWIERLANGQISRRDFLKGSAVATAAVASLSLVGCGETDVETTTESPEETTTEEQPIEHSPIVDIEEGGEWLPAACWHNCGGRCMNKVMVKDGAVVRQKTDDTHADSFDYPQQRGCVRGKAQQQQCFGPDRIKYPMKRKNWQPGGVHVNGHLRGIDEWERISWEDAIKMVASEYKRINETYGPAAFLVGNYGSIGSDKVLSAMGGFTSVADSTSHGVYLLNTSSTIGLPSYGSNRTNDRMDMLNADYVILHSANPAWSAAGTPSYHFIRAKEAGVKFITIDPIYTQSAQMLDADWVPVHTGTDTALFLAVAYEMLQLDAKNGDVIDWDFMEKYTIGFDAEHANPQCPDVNTRDYIEGKIDGVAKNAEWASKITGTPVEKIKMLASVLGKKNNVWLLQNFGAARNNGAENLPQIFLTVGCLGGHMGKKGNCTACNYHANAGNGGPALVGASSKSWGKRTDASLKTYNLSQNIIPGPQVWDACLSGKYRNVGQFYGSGLNKNGGFEMEADIHCIAHVIQAAYLQTGPNQKKGIEVHRRMDFVVSKAQFMTTNAKYSDIILPVAASWEKYAGLTTSNREALLCWTKITDPMYESKTDQEIDSLLLTELGFDALAAFPRTEEQTFINQLAGAWATNLETGEREVLVKITQEDLDEWGVEGVPQDGKMTIKEFIARGGYQVERKLGDAQSEYLNHDKFINGGGKQSSPSGKFELCSQAKADLFNKVGLTDYDFKPYPEYMVPVRGIETTFKNGEIGGEKGEYPFLLFNPHYIRRSHTVFDNCSWLREAHGNPVFLNASDAKAKGIANGDTVKIWTEWGAVLRNACCMETIMPGQVAIPHGCWVDVDEETGIDRAGSDNYLLGNIISGCGVTGYNNNNCNYEKYDGPALKADHLWDARIFDLD